MSETKLAQALPPGCSLKTLAILSALLSFASISTDLYLPALPAIAAELQEDAGTIELTISGYLVGFSLGQLFWGPIGDRYGRRLPIMVGLLLFIIGSAGCATSTTVTAMIGWRIVQALGACASVVLARAMIRDLYVGHQAARMLSSLMTVMAIAPLIGPSLGGGILHVASWRFIFWSLVGVGIATLWALRALPETLPEERRSRQTIPSAMAHYGQLLRSRQILGYAGAGGFFYGGMFAYIAGTPSAYISYYRVSPQCYGLLFALGIVGIMLTNHLNSRWVASFGIDHLLRYGAAAAAISGGLLAVTTGIGVGGLIGLLIPLFLFVSATGFIVANSIVGALGSYPERAGAVSALVGTIQYGTGIFGSALVGFFADGTPWPMAWIIAAFGTGSLVCAVFLAPASGAGLNEIRDVS
ncbi:multidrug effflux MFS transporter [Dechloromonas denitrificans]|uniref:multidrug effflux MFS transporter n=1 Tax=Dechloromonas denitrificans TaxID=281362 RepID=UPI001CFABC0C|nr:multidrug effflux MFS transporter [Dechloromonas denitrificans]UCV08681.1 multidrug effflux MFS transporter [Dechloromonas denitrificans]